MSGIGAEAFLTGQQGPSARRMKGIPALRRPALSKPVKQFVGPGMKVWDQGVAGDASGETFRERSWPGAPYSAAAEA